MKRLLSHTPALRLYHFLAEPLAAADAVAVEHLIKPDRQKDLRLIAIVLVAALSLMTQHYFLNDPNRLLNWIANAGLAGVAQALFRFLNVPGTDGFNQLLFWMLGIIALYLVVPAIVLKVLCVHLGDVGFKAPVRKDISIYGILLVLVLPLVIVAARHPDFLRSYPFYRPQIEKFDWFHFAVLEVLYMLQFVAVEFFFRGLLIHGVKHRLGAFSILFPLIPYMMIHFGKPLAECAGSLAAGLILGFMSLRTGSIALGIILHAAVAVTMDMAALQMHGLLF